MKVEAKEQGRTNPGGQVAVAPHICVGPQYGTSGVQNVEMAPKFLESLYTPAK